jgi:hypothetical protein
VEEIRISGQAVPASAVFEHVGPPLGPNFDVRRPKEAPWGQRAARSVSEEATTMRFQVARIVMVVTALAGLAACGETHAQYGGGYGPPYGGSAGALAGNPGASSNPVANPYMNPYLNPYFAQFPNSPATMATYMMAANASAGGIGSGQISGVRPGARTQVARQRTERPEERPTAQPGVPSSISRYFGRNQPRSAATANHYNRAGRYYTLTRH